MTIGWGSAASTGAPIVFPGFDFSARMLGLRALAFLPPLALLPVAILAFDRFDPARRAGSASAKPSLSARLSAAPPPRCLASPRDRRPGGAVRDEAGAGLGRPHRPPRHAQAPAAARRLRSRGRAPRASRPFLDGCLAPLRRVRPPRARPRRHPGAGGEDGARARRRGDARRRRALRSRQARERGGHGAPHPRPLRREGLHGPGARPSRRGGGRRSSRRRWRSRSGWRAGRRSRSSASSSPSGTSR